MFSIRRKKKQPESKREDDIPTELRFNFFTKRFWSSINTSFKKQIFDKLKTPQSKSDFSVVLLVHWFTSNIFVKSINFNLLLYILLIYIFSNDFSYLLNNLKSVKPIYLHFFSTVYSFEFIFVKSIHLHLFIYIYFLSFVLSIQYSNISFFVYFFLHNLFFILFSYNLLILYSIRPIKGLFDVPTSLVCCDLFIIIYLF